MKSNSSRTSQQSMRPKWASLVFIFVLAALVASPALRPRPAAATFMGVPSVRVSPDSSFEIRWVADCVGTPPNPAAGILFFVTTLDDHDDGVCNADCTLREAIKAANANPGNDDGIEFTVTGTVNLTSVLPDITGGVAIDGPGPNLLTVRRNLGGSYRIFNVTTTGAVAFSGLTISNGLTPMTPANGAGGGISNSGAGTVTIAGCTISGNVALGGGGVRNSAAGTVNVTNSTVAGNNGVGNAGIENAGLLNVTNSTVSDNVATSGPGGGIGNSGTANVTNSTIRGNQSLSQGGDGGGISNGGTLNITNSTISGNTAAETSGGGIFNSIGTATITGSTISGNRASDGGGVSNSDEFGAGTVNVTNSTIIGNSADAAGGGIDNFGNSLANIKSSIIAWNIRTLTGTLGPDAFGDFTSGGFNLIGETDDSTGFNQSTDLTGTVAFPLNPMLDPNGLQDNGGPTKTIALIFGSPAIDSGTSNGLTGTLTTDQRGSGFARTVNDPLIANSGGDGTDIGAFEKQTITPTLQFSSATYNVNENAASATITVTRANDTSVAATVNYATSDGTATAGSDYTATSGTLSFASGDTSKTLSIPIINESLDEINETVNLTLNNVTGNAALGTPNTAVLTIVDDDSLPGLSVNDVSMAEGNSGTSNANFTVSLSAASGQTVTVNYATANGTATAGSDYVATSGTLTFTSGQTSKTIPVTVNGDTTLEPDETFFVDLSSPANATITRSRGTGTITNDDAAPTPTPTPNVVQFSASNYNVQEDCTTVTITVNRVGATSGAASVDYNTSDVTATERKDYITTLGRLNFAAGETSKSFAVLINEDSFVEGAETFNINLSNPSGVALGGPAIATVTIIDDSSEPTTNVIDDPENYVCQHYHDFLNRQPDTSGLQFWTNQITSCAADAACVENRRINVSAAFYLSIEFQQTGYLVERLYKAAYGSATGDSTFPSNHQLPVPIVRLNEFLFDTQKIGKGVIVGQSGWEQVLENNKQSFTAEFVTRARFTAVFPSSLSVAQFVDTLNANAGNPLSQAERDQLVNDLSSRAKTRAQVLRAVAEDSDLANAEFNRAFVLMQFFGYLRRNPNDPQDKDYSGYDFWLTKLNQFNGNFIDAEMVKAFIISIEYRQRFGS